MKRTAVVIAPGRGTYNKGELGYLRNHHPGWPPLEAFDAYRAQQGQAPISALDGAERFAGELHTRGDNASPLIYACGLADFASIDRERFEIVGITGNSMGWYTALACGGALDPMAGLQVVNTMGSLMQEQMIGGQLIYPFVDENWVEPPGARAALLDIVAGIGAREGHELCLSIDLGGMLVLAGNAAGLEAFSAAVPPVQGRFPMRLPNHAGFHSPMQAPISRTGLERLPATLFAQPRLPLIDGRGAIWYPLQSPAEDLRAYTLGDQVTTPYDFTTALRVAARELMPDCFIILGPGTTLGGASAQALIRNGWRDWRSKRDVQVSPEDARLLSMGDPAMRAICT